MKDVEKTIPLVVQTKIAQSKSKNLLLRLHVPGLRSLEQLEGIFSDTAAMRVIVTSSDVSENVQKDTLSHTSFDFLPRRTVRPNPSHTSASFDQRNDFTSVVSGKSLKQIEKIVIEQVINNLGGSVPKAAKTLRVSPSTLYRKRESWGENT